MLDKLAKRVLDCATDEALPETNEKRGLKKVEMIYSGYLHYSPLGIYSGITALVVNAIFVRLDWARKPSSLILYRRPYLLPDPLLVVRFRFEVTDG